MFNELGAIFGDPAQCKAVFPLNQYPSGNEEKLELEDGSTNATPSAFQSDSSGKKECPSPSSCHRRERSPTPTSHVRGKREFRTLEVGEALKEWAEASKAKTPTISRFEESSQCNAYSITNCVRCLESIEGVDGSTYIKAIKMFKDVDWREMFMAMSAERRLVWLASLE